jgi:hypothetical protein
LNYDWISDLIMVITIFITWTVTVESMILEYECPKLSIIFDLEMKKYVGVVKSDSM